MSEFVVDASAILALSQGEPGYHTIDEIRTRSIVSTINLTEALSKLIRHKVPPEFAQTFLASAFPHAIAFDREQAELAAVLHARSRGWGLSYADCACLALGKLKDRTVITADRRWEELDFGVRIRLLR